MERKFNVYKGLQKPLTYKGFSGKFIYWGIGSLVLGLALGAVAIALIGMLPGIIVLCGCIGGGLFHTLNSQKAGLHQKSKATGTFHFQSKINPRIYEQAQPIQDALYRHRPLPGH